MIDYTVCFYVTNTTSKEIDLFNDIKNITNNKKFDNFIAFAFYFHKTIRSGIDLNTIKQNYRYL